MWSDLILKRKTEPTYITEQKEFPKRLKLLLEETNTSQAKLSKYLDITRQTISLYVTGQSTPDIYIFEKIAEYFEVSYDYLLGKTESKVRENIGISEKLGLSDVAIKALEKIFNDDLSIVKIGLNLFYKIIENKDFESLLYHSRTFFRKQQLLNFHIESNTSDDIIFKLYDDRDLYLFRTQQLFIRIIQTIAEQNTFADEIEKQTQEAINNKQKRRCKKRQQLEE